MSSAPTAPGDIRRNPGPRWGYRFLRALDFVAPEFVFKPLRAAGTFVAMLFMPAQRRHSREYLSLVLPRPPTWRDVLRHFFAFEESLMTKLRVLNGRPHRTVFAPGTDAADARLWTEDDGEPVFFGSFHIGVSDLQGFQLGGGPGARPRRKTCILRERVANAHDTDRLAAKYGGGLEFIWINDPHEMLHALKDAAAGDCNIALQCDRAGQGARMAAFDFLGTRREFPVTIYILAALFKRPVLLSVGVPATPSLAVLHAAPLFKIIPGETRDATLARGREHFQAFLRQIEPLLRNNPWQWFNFTPWNFKQGAAQKQTAQL